MSGTAATGIQCGLLAEQGMDGTMGVFEDERGFAGLYNDGIAELANFNDLGRVWRLESVDDLSALLD